MFATALLFLLLEIIGLVAFYFFGQWEVALVCAGIAFFLLFPSKT